MYKTINEAHGLAKADIKRVKDLIEKTKDKEIKRILKFLVKSNVEVDKTQDVTKMKKENKHPMKITKKILERIIKEEIERTIKEIEYMGDVAGATGFAHQKQAFDHGSESDRKDAAALIRDIATAQTAGAAIVAMSGLVAGPLLSLGSLGSENAAIQAIAGVYQKIPVGAQRKMYDLAFKAFKNPKNGDWARSLVDALNKISKGVPK